MQTPNVDLCENYQLKWSSYNSYIHSCIASSLINDDSFADVALVTMDGHKIMAHRFILSYASQYLNKALKFQPKVTSALPLMIVLPQTITYKALKILVKYMYSGETTVPKDILNIVLKAGDILKVKGLYREPGSGGGNGDIDEKISKNSTKSDSDSLISMNTDSKEGVASSNHVTPQLYVNSNTSSQKLLQNQIEATKTNLEQSNTSLLKTSSKLHITHCHSSNLNKTTTTTSTSSSSSSLKAYPHNKGQKVLNFTMTNFNGSIIKVPQPKSTITLNKKVLKQQQSDKPHTITSAEAAAAESNSNGPAAISATSTSTSSTTASAAAAAAAVADSITANNFLPTSNNDNDHNHNANDDDDDDDDDADDDDDEDDIDNENDTKSNIADMSYLDIKSEPLDWTEEPDDDENMSIVNDDKIQCHEEIVKTEPYDGDSASNDDEPQSDLYTPLTCELCTESFRIPAEWVKHVETHTDMLPAKRRRRDSPEDEDKNATYPQLQCDLCEKPFNTPAEWVQHIQNAHTDFELSIFNRRTDKMKKSDLNKYKFI